MAFKLKKHDVHITSQHPQVMMTGKKTLDHIDPDSGLSTIYYDTLLGVVTIAKSCNVKDCRKIIRVTKWKPVTYGERFKKFGKVETDKNRLNIQRLDREVFIFSERLIGDRLRKLTMKEIKLFLNSIQQIIEPNGTKFFPEESS
ncbi:MAG: hypothetical protein WCG55_03405 [bacterium]